MAGEIIAIGMKVLYAPETTAGTKPSTGWKEKATGATLNIAEFVTNIDGLSADYDTHDATTISATTRKQFKRGLQNNDGKVTMTGNFSPTSRDDWTAIRTEYEGLTGGKSLWWQVIFGEDDTTKGFFFRGEPMPVGMPNIAAGDLPKYDFTVIEDNMAGWDTAITS